MASDNAHKGYQALIFGASGITGWALMRECLQYPSPDTFARIIGLTNRPLKAEDALMPERPGRWELHSGMDLSKGVDVVKEQLKAIASIEEVTHVYFASYTGHGSDYQELKRANVQILENAVLAVDALCPKLQFWTLQTGGKAYGVEFRDNVPYHPPLTESSPRIPEPYASNIFYYAQYDLMLRLSQSKPWTFTEIRPDAIIGFVPNNNAMNLAQCLGLFLAFCRWKEGNGAVVEFPGSESAWKARHSDSSQDILARFHIFASLHPERVREKAFNIADGEVVTWEGVWAGICGWFGLKGVGPGQGKGGEKGTQWLKSQRGEWGRWEKENGLKEGMMEATGWEFMEALVVMIEFNREYDLSRAREAGFEETVDTVVGYHLAFERMREAKIIP